MALQAQRQQTLAAPRLTKSTDQARAIAGEAMVFAYSMIYNYKTLYQQTQDYLNPGYVGGFGRYRHYARVYTPTDVDIVTPNNDTPYSWAWLDLRREPMVLTVPPVTDRYYVIQLFDLFPYNFAYIGSRATGSQAGSYLIAGPNWTGRASNGIVRVIRAETDIVGLLTRTALFGPEDIANVRAIQRSYVLQPLSEFAAVPPPPPVPQLNFPTWDEQKALSSSFIGYLNFLLQFVVPHPSEIEFYARCAGIGIGPARPFQPGEIPKDFLKAIEQGATDGVRAVDDEAAQTTSSNGLFGAREFLGNLYLKRAVGVKLGIYGNSQEEAVYVGAHADADGKRLVGANRYIWRFEPDQIPPVDFFWSATMYSLPDRHLVANSIDRYSISDRTPGLLFENDGALEITLQHEEPDTLEERANWLPAPEGPFDVVVRLYGPKDQVLSGEWQLPLVRLAAAP